MGPDNNNRVVLGPNKSGVIQRDPIMSQKEAISFNMLWEEYMNASTLTVLVLYTKPTFLWQILSFSDTTERSSSITRLILFSPRPTITTLRGMMISIALAVRTERTQTAWSRDLLYNTWCHMTNNLTLRDFCTAAQLLGAAFPAGKTVGKESRVQDGVRGRALPTGSENRSCH